MPGFSFSSFAVPPDPKASFAGQTILITGGNTGLGLAAAIKFLNLSATKVIITTRSLSSSETTKAKIESLTHRSSALEIWHLDMNSYPSIVSLAQKASTLSRLDIVILNAGIAPRYFTQSATGWESAIQINVLANSLLGLLLLPALRSKGGLLPRLEIVAARAHEDVVLSEAQKSSMEVMSACNVEDEKVFDGHRQYIISKLFLVYAMKSLAELGRGEDGEVEVVVNAVCPGACVSELGREYSGGMWDVIKRVAGKTILKTAEEGARTYVIGVLKGKESHGRFIQGENIRPEVGMVAGEEGDRLRVNVWGEVLAELRNNVPELAGYRFQ